MGLILTNGALFFTFVAAKSWPIVGGVYAMDREHVDGFYLILVLDGKVTFPDFLESTLISFLGTGDLPSPFGPATGV